VKEVLFSDEEQSEEGTSENHKMFKALLCSQLLKVDEPLQADQLPKKYNALSFKHPKITQVVK